MKRMLGLQPMRFLLIYMWVTPGVLSLLGPVYNLTNPETGTNFLVLSEKSDDTRSLADAQAKCREINRFADVGEIANASDNAIVQQLMDESNAKSTSHWLGIHDVWTDAAFCFLRTGQPITYSGAWKDGHPNIDLSKNCAARNADSHDWEEEACRAGEDRGVLCSIPRDQIALITACPFPAVSHNGSCYDFHHSGTFTFAEGRLECEAVGDGYMPVPNSVDDVRFIQLYAQLFGLDKVWLGIWDDEIDEVFKSLSGEAIPYFNWEENESEEDQGEVACVALQAGKGTIEDCGASKGIVCQVSPAKSEKQPNVDADKWSKPLFKENTEF